MMKRLAEKTESRPKAISIVAVAVTLATFVQDTGAQPADQRPAVQLVQLLLVDAAELHEGVRRGLERELDRILGRLDVTAELLDADTFVAEDPLDGVIKVLILPRNGAAWGVPADAMGAIRRRPGGTSCTTIYVFHPVIVRALRDAQRQAERPTRFQVGRAIGRVILHELVHAVAPEQPHAEHGIMAAEQRRPQLLNAGGELDAASARALREGLDARSGQHPAKREPRPGGRAAHT